MTEHAAGKVRGRFPASFPLTRFSCFLGWGVQVDAIRKGIATGSDTSVCLLNYRADGSPFWNQFFVAPLRDLNQNVVYYVGAQCVIDKPIDEKVRSTHRRVGERGGADLWLCLCCAGRTTELRGCEERGGKEKNDKDKAGPGRRCDWRALYCVYMCR